jgi:alkylation response protein AidB-like acyl-CoA dehydrogenase
MEMTIARDRWQQHLKTRGGFYAERGTELRALHARHGDVGALTAALAVEALGGVFEACRVGRLTRNQHILLRLGELAAYAECAGSLAYRAAAALEGEQHPKADQRFAPATLAAIARVFARDAALKVAEEGLRWVRGASDDGTDLTGLEQSLRLSDVQTAQAGLLADMDAVADAIYGRI